MRSFRTFAIITAVLAVPLVACGDSDSEVSIAPKEPRVDRATALHGVSFTPSRTDLSAGERQQLTAFVRGLPSNQPVVTLLTSSESPGLQARRAAAVSGQLRALGVPVARTVRSPGYDVGSDTVLVSAETWSASALPCPDWSKTGGVYDGLNLPLRNLGCATARNIADMVDNPRDLEVGRRPGPGSGHLGAAAVDRLYNDKVKGAGAGGGSSGVTTPTAGATTN